MFVVVVDDFFLLLPLFQVNGVGRLKKKRYDKRQIKINAAFVMPHFLLISEKIDKKCDFKIKELEKLF